MEATIREAAVFGVLVAIGGVSVAAVSAVLLVGVQSAHEIVLISAYIFVFHGLL